MRAGDLKKLISKIPDEDEITFLYGEWDFGNVEEILHGKEIKKFVVEEGYDYDDSDYYPSGKHDWLMLFDN